MLLASYDYFKNTKISTEGTEGKITILIPEHFTDGGIFQIQQWTRHIENNQQILKSEE